MGFCFSFDNVLQICKQDQTYLDLHFVMDLNFVMLLHGELLLV